MQELEQQFDDKRETSMRDFLSVLFRRKWVILGVLLASIGVVIVLQLTAPAMYESTSQVMLSRGTPESAYNPAARMMVSWEEELNSEMEASRSAHVVEMAQKLLDDAGARDGKGKPIQVTPSNISTTTMSRSSILYIKYRNLDPVAAQEACRAVTQAYTNFRVTVRSVPELDAYFREEIDSAKDQLEDWEQKRADFMDEESVSRIPDERASLLMVRQQTDLDLSRVRANLAEAQAQVEVLQRSLDMAASDSSFDFFLYSEATTKDDQPLAQIKQSLVAKKTDLLTVRSQYQDTHPTVIAMKEQVDQLARLYQTEATNYLSHLRGGVEILRAREESLLSTLAYIDSELGSYPSKEARLASFDRVIDALKADYTALVDRQIKARLERIGSPDWNVLVLQPASEPVPIRLHDLIRLILIPIIGLITGMALAFLVDGLDHSVKDATEAEHHLGLPVLGSVGRLR